MLSLSVDAAIGVAMYVPYIYIYIYIYIYHSPKWIGPCVCVCLAMTDIVFLWVEIPHCQLQAHDEIFVGRSGTGQCQLYWCTCSEWVASHRDSSDFIVTYGSLKGNSTERFIL